MTSQITAGEVTISVGDGETITLKPTLRAATIINRRFNGLLPAIQQIGQLDVEAMAVIVSAGAGLSDREAKDLPEKLFRAGAVNVASKAIEFVRFLLNGGRDEAESGDGSAEGNGRS